MANLSITTHCNRTCSYCFARPVHGKTLAGSAHMSEAVFRRSLDFIVRSGESEVRLIGGEPTLHPQFADFAAAVISEGLMLFVFSNGLIPENQLSFLQQQSPDRLSILINTITPDARQRHDRSRQRSTLKRLSHLTSLGINLQSPASDPGFLLDVIHEYALRPFIRLGLAHPCADKTNRFLHPRHYQTVGRKVSDLFKRAVSQGVALEFDCGFVPCMFPDDVRPFIEKQAPDIGRRCNPIVDILPNGQAIACYPLGGLAQIPITDTQRVRDLCSLFEEKFALCRKVGIYAECSSCSKRKKGKCVGGCLSAAMMRLHNRSCQMADPKHTMGTSRQKPNNRSADSTPGDVSGNISKPTRKTGRSPLPTTRRIHADLPIFRIQSQDQCALYAPGYAEAVSDSDADGVEAMFVGRHSPSKIPSATETIAARLHSRAKVAVAERERWLSSPYEPECLTLYPSNSCELGCIYCYAKREASHAALSQHGLTWTMDENTLRAAATQVAKTCAQKKLPFHLVLHGGGEPAHSFDRVIHLHALTREIADRFDIEWFGYIATNGVMSEKKIRWLAGNFTKIGISCDGPPDIQNRQRPMKDGRPSSKSIESAVRILTGLGKPVVIRSTITPESMAHQVRIVDYLCNHLGASDITFEPLYGRMESGNRSFTERDADIFVRQFLSARMRAATFGCRISLSGIRIDEIHGPYCDVLQNVLRLGPDGNAMSCFLHTGSDKNGWFDYKIGYFNKDSDQYILNAELINAHRRKAAAIPETCRPCINLFHCARNCPEGCALHQNKSPDSEKSAAENFRCRTYRLLGARRILEAARPLRHTVCKNEFTPLQRDIDRAAVLDYSKDLSPAIDREKIIHQYDCLTDRYDIKKHSMPPPVWRQSGVSHQGEELWHHLQSNIAMRPKTAPMSIYIHIPFCDRRCGFCDCHSIMLRRNRIKREARFVKTLMQEIKYWSQMAPLQARPVTTIHFGGGTPGCLTAHNFQALINQCRRLFLIMPTTELAVETTSSLMGKESLARMQDWGISRIHVGVQTLADHLRQFFGRRDTADELLRKVDLSMDMGFITSVDLLYGLPRQSFDDMHNTLQNLLRIGTHGFSLYRLNISKRNRWFLNRKADRFRPDPIHDYMMFQLADAVLVDAGYQKNYYNHYAQSRDRNLYFTHPQRGEDLLAIGPTADGVFNRYHYRHPGYGKYIKGRPSGRPSLAGGWPAQEDNPEYSAAVSSLMGGAISADIIEKAALTELVQDWIKCGCLKRQADRFMLSANGSWMVREMLREFAIQKNRVRIGGIP